MYGHGNEVYTIDISHDGKFLASGQKAQEIKNAKLYLWDINNKKLIKQLDGCTLTIVQISFSPSDNFILTVSRDRSWNLYIKNNDSYELFQNMKNAHKRIIWTCSWTLDEQYFATGSRDKFINIWKKGEDNKFKKYTNLETKEAVTAIEFIGKIYEKEGNKKYIFIAGFESGKIILGKFEEKEKTIKILYEINKFLENGAKTQKIRNFIKEKENICYFATCSEDYSVRIFKLNLSELENII